MKERGLRSPWGSESLETRGFTPMSTPATPARDPLSGHYVRVEQFLVLRPSTR